MKIRRLASSHGVGPSLWKSQMAALGRKKAAITQRNTIEHSNFWKSLTG
jgi:hypothetical protein